MKILIASAVFCIVTFAFCSLTLGQAPSTGELKKLTIEDLMKIEVTSVSKKAERAGQAAAAIDVITDEDIRRSGAVTLPEVLRLSYELQVAQVDGSTWAISARGFNTALADKLLVLIDGRTVYSPFFGGVFWNVQDVLLEDVDRIEVISGPGATLWGANAVNGIINIITKNAKETQGSLLKAGSGNEMVGVAAARYGGTTRNKTYYRFYSKYHYQGDLELVGDRNAHDPARIGQLGFRTDWESGQDSITFQGDAYHELEGDQRLPAPHFSGGNLIGTWTRSLAGDSNIQFHFYYDGTRRDSPLLIKEDRDAFDLDFQHQLSSRGRHSLLWGAGYRTTSDRTRGTATLSFNPAARTYPLYSVFAEDDIGFLAKRLIWTVGTKLEHNDFSGFEVEPSIRLAYRPRDTEVIWGAISRAVRMPTRRDSDLHPLQAGPITLIGNPHFESETALAYEFGYRRQLRTNLELNVSLFYNVYDHLRSQEPQLPSNNTFIFANKLDARTYGAEIGVNYAPLPRWRLRTGYVYLGQHFRLDPGSRDPIGGSNEGNDPKNHFLIRSYLDLPKDFEFDVTSRFMGVLPLPLVPRYFEMNARLGRTFRGKLELSLVGQNLLHGQHLEFRVPSELPEEVQRSIYGLATWRF